MNVDAKPFVPSPSSELVTASSATISSAGAKEHHHHHKENKKQDQQRRRRRHARRGRNSAADGPSKEEKSSIPKGSRNASTKPKENCAGSVVKHVEGDIHKDDAAARLNTQNKELTKHQQQSQQKQRRRRRNNINKKSLQNNNPEDADTNSQMGPKAAQQSSTEKGSTYNGQHRAQRHANHRKHKNKRMNDQSTCIDIDNNTIDTMHKINEASVTFNESSFPTLATPPGTLVANDAGDDGGGTSWNKSLASKITSSLELEEDERQQQMQEELDRAQSKSIAQLTMLSSRASTSKNDINGIVKKESTSRSVTPEGESLSALSAADSSSPSLPIGAQNNVQQSTITLNIKSKWIGSELTKMRQRWWEAVRAKRKKSEEDWKKQRQLKKTDTDEFADDVKDASENHLQDYEEDSSSSADSSSFSYSDEENTSYSAPYHDAMQPPSLSTPFDEMAMLNLQSPPPEPPRVPESVLDLEQTCIQSSHPLHCAIYNHALLSHNYEDLQHNHGGRNDVHSDTEKSDAEVVLHLLLTEQNPTDVMRWKCERVGLASIRGLEANDNYQESRAKYLTEDVDAGLLSADTTSLTPLQLAIYWNLPVFIRLLCTTAVPSMTDKYNKTEEEDGNGRTPLMLACELGYEACIQTIFCVSSPKLDRRERDGGNTAFHFCCIAPREDGGIEEDMLDCDMSGRVGAINMLLRYTPTAMKKRALMLTNCKGQNLLHLACSQGDMHLIERLLAHRNVPGVKISKALDAKDRFGYTPFLAAVAADATDIVMHLLTTRLGAGSRPDISSWFAGCPLIVAASKNSVDMTKLLLEIVYDASTVRKLPGIGEMAHTEANRALLESIYRMVEEDEEERSSTYEIIRLLISQGGANPHLPVFIRFPGKPKTQGDRTVSLCYLKGNMAQEDVPLSAAVRASDAEAVRCMIDAYSSALGQLKELRRNDPLLQPQPESYFRRLEERENDAVYSSVDAALVASLFLLWKEIESSSYGRCALVLYKRGRLNLSSTATPRNLSQRAMQWLEKCLSTSLLVAPPSLKNNSMEGYYFDAPMVQYQIPNVMEKMIADRIPYRNAGANFMDWSYVLAQLPWFRSQINGVNCKFMQNMISDHDEMEHADCMRILSEDEFFLVADGEKLLAHKSIVSARSGKLAAHIRFTEAHEQEGNQISVHVNLSPWIAKMLLCHCYHGSIALGLLRTPLKQSRQLLEIALVAEEYLLNSLLLECEIRLLMQTSSKMKCGSMCICPQCTGETIFIKEQIDCPTQLQCVENAQTNINDGTISLHCEPAGVYACKTSTFIMMSSHGGLVTPESALDVLAVAQQLEQSLSCQQGFYSIKYCRSSSIDDPNSTMAMPSCGGWNINAGKDVGAGLISVPFAAAKMMAIWVMLRNFPAVIRSDSYLRQINGDANEDAIDEADAPFEIGSRASSDEDTTLLLRTCLDELMCSPFKKN